MLLSLLLTSLTGCSGMDVEVPPSVTEPAPTARETRSAPVAQPKPTASKEPAASAPSAPKNPELAGITDPPEVNTLTDATALNNAGHRYYEAGNYVAAIKVWTRGTVLHPEHTLLHYNLACAQALQRAQHGPCAEVEVYMKDIFNNLDVAAADPKRRARMLKDSDLVSVRNTLAFQRIASANELSPSETKRWLAAAPLYSLGNGAFGSIYSYQLHLDGMVVRSLTKGGRYVTCGEVDAECPGDEPVKGTWTYSYPTVTLTFGDSTTEYSLSPRGSLFAVDPFKSLNVWPSECDA